MSKLQVKEIMIKGVITVKADDSIITVARLLERKKVHALPVIDNKNKVIGIVAETDFYLKNELDFHIPTYINFVKNTNFKKVRDVINEPQIQTLISAKVSDIMTTDCVVVNENLEIDQLIRLFKERKLYTIPVVSKANVLVGIVTVADILKLI